MPAMSKARESLYIALLFLVAFPAFWGVWALQSRQAKGRIENEPRAAWELCEAAVANHLKAPATARFQAFEWVQALPEVDQQEPAAWYHVRGWVDSENSFGALIRSDWSCRANIETRRATVNSITAR